MKTIIIYATKYGAAGEVAQRIAGKISGALVHNLKQDGVPDLAGFDCIIIGSSVYAGMIRKEIKVFLRQNANVLLDKKLGLFLCGLGGGSNDNKGFDTAFPAEILQKAKATCFTGGIFDPQKAGVVERLIIKIVTKRSGYINNINDGKIDKFADAMKS
jgi:menaquinone-dependent protoporphyrinogen oxidase